MSEPVEIVRIPFHGTEVIAVDEDGQPRIVLKPALDAIGVDFATQFTKLRRRSWACVGQRPMQLPGDTQSRTHMTVDVRTFLMLLATIDENRVPERVRPLLVAYQREVADVIEAYWTKGAAVQLDVEVGPQHQVPQTLSEALRMAADSLDRAEVAEKQVAELEVVKTEQGKELASTRPKAAYVDAFVDPAEDVTTIGDFAQQLGLSEQVLRDYLVKHQVIWRRVLGRRYSRSQGREVVEYQWRARKGYEGWFTSKDHPEVQKRLYNGQIPRTLYVNPVGKVRIKEMLAATPIEEPSNVTNLPARRDKNGGAA